ncbi:MAG: CPBP family intramembrane metalloprotease [Bacteroidales bacterium]|nr:CPBP family intramembrane metalloprotease [Candidatus Cryptobacteroides choladohippi]MCQ2178703.1 CPBP family intramembrane metalloprotease [Bacteroidales bacterium]
MLEAPKRRGSYNIIDNFTYYVPGWADILVLLVLLLVGTVLGSLLALPFSMIMGEDGIEYSMLVSYPMMFIPPMIYASVKSRSNSYLHNGVRLDSGHFSPVGALSCALMAMALTLAGGYVVDLPTSLLPAMPEWLEKALGSMTQGKFLLNFICVSLFAPFFEEWLCRGMVLRGLLHRGVRPVWAIVFSAAFFAFIHMNPWQAIPAFAMGCAMGYVYYKTGSLKLTMLMHFTNNTLALALGNVEGLSAMDSYRQLFPAAIYWALFAACIAVIVLAVIKFAGVELQDKAGNSDKVASLFSE